MHKIPKNKCHLVSLSTMMFSSWSTWIAAIFFHNSRIGKTVLQCVLFEIGVAVALFCIPPHSILAWWRPLALFLRQWPRCLPTKPEWTQGGPLGEGCAKVCEVIAGCLLWTLRKEPLPLVLVESSWPPLWTWLAVGVLCVVTNQVMEVWSAYQNNKYDHTGVHALVDSSVGRSLTRREHLKLLGLAIVNAACEEISSRGFWKAEFYRYSSSMVQANLAQAITFGWWHYHGIPSGWTGVALTFVYGGIMGLLQDYYGGLLLPIVAHSMADYFIFAVIARRVSKQE